MCNQISSATDLLFPNVSGVGDAITGGDLYGVSSAYYAVVAARVKSYIFKSVFQVLSNMG